MDVKMETQNLQLSLPLFFLYFPLSLPLVLAKISLFFSSLSLLSAALFNALLFRVKTILTWPPSWSKEVAPTHVSCSLLAAIMPAGTSCWLLLQNAEGMLQHCCSIFGSSSPTVHKRIKHTSSLKLSYFSSHLPWFQSNIKPKIKS